ncbi:MAG: response regulator [Candidatus Omnitrophica bacterium]|nr:response regulator [Candidatus Omnitrophota bacterium]
MDKKKVLVIDDEKDVRDLVAEQLRVLRYHAIVASNGYEGLEKVKQENPDLIILDLLMAGMSGYETFMRLRQAGIQTPVIALSGRKGMEGLFEKGQLAGFILKPYESRELLEKVEMTIGPSDIREKKFAVIVAAEEFLLHKLGGFCSGAGFEALVTSEADEAFQWAVEKKPAFILCEFLESTEIVDAVYLNGKLQQHVFARNIPLFVFCKEEAFGEALKSFRGFQVINYEESVDLLSKIGTVLKIAP